VRIPELFKDTYAAWSDDNASRMAAALAYYAAFALAPLLIIVIEIGAAVLGGSGHHHVVEDAIFKHLEPSIGADGVKALGSIVSATFQQQQRGRFGAAIGWIIFVVAASGFFAAIESTLDSVWHVTPAKQSLRGAVLARCKSVAIIAAISVVVLLSVVATTGFAALSGAAAAMLDAVISFVVVSVCFAALFKYLPKTSIDWSDVRIGAVISGALFMIGQLLIGLYLGRASVTSAYGAAGSFVALLLWLYYSAQIFLFGAEFTKTYAQRIGSKSRSRGG
jgi:membrane protein